MERVEALIEIGKKLGLEGNDLIRYVSEQEDKQLEREKEKENQAREDRLLERELKRLDIEKMEKDKSLQLALYDKEIELEKAKKFDPTGAAAKVSADVRAKLPKLPHFNDKQDSMDAYRKRFERFAESAGWGKDQWATHLSALLQGKALDVYSRMSLADSFKYDSLKEALLQRFQLTEEGFRSKYRTSKPDVGETPQQFVVRLEDYLLRWMGLAKVPETFDGLKDLFLREQFMQVSNKSLQVFLKEHKVRSVHEMTVLAQQYQEAHEFNPSQSFRGRANTPQYVDSGSPQTKPHPSQSNEKDRVCYNCRSSSHFIKDCPQLKEKSPKFKAGALSQVETFRGRGRFSSRGRYVGRGGYRGANNRSVQSDTNSITDNGKRDVANLVVENSLDRGLQNESVTLVSGQKLPFMTAACRDDDEFGLVRNMPVVDGFMNDQHVQVLRDSGCSGVVVRRSLVEADCLTGRSQMCVLVDGTVRKFPVARISVDTPFYAGQLDALCAERPVYDLIIGNVPGVRYASNPDVNWKRCESPSGEGQPRVFQETKEKSEVSGAVQTRAQKVKEGKHTPLKVAEPISNVSVADIRNAQEIDNSLARARDLANSGDILKGKNDSEQWYEKENGLLYRNFYSPKVENGKRFRQLLVPVDMRNQVLQLAHDSILGGHLGVRKMVAKVLSEFYWPRVQTDIAKYCKSCDICQKTFAKGKVTKVPIGELPLIDTPFDRVAVDLVGPNFPPSEKGNRFILTMVDFSTRYPEAVALKRIDTETVAEALVDMFSRVGFPKEVLSDMGRQFTSDTMKEVSRLLSIKQLTTTPYNPACNGMVERFNGTLKSMLKKMCAEQPKQWDRYISPLLFAYREAPQESTGFSPFELLYGRTVRGPLMILRELWTNNVVLDEVKTTYEYVLDLRNRLEETVKLAQVELSKNKARYKQYADRKRRPRHVEVGEKVLVLLPTDKNKLLMQLKGPYVVTEKINEFDYKVRVDGKERMYHINLLRKYIERNTGDSLKPVEVKAGKDKEVCVAIAINDEENHVDEILSGVIDQVCVAVIEETDDELQSDTVTEESDLQSNSEEYCRRQMTVNLPSLVANETIDDVKINPELTTKQRGELFELLREFPDVLIDVPGYTNLIEHEVKLTTSVPARSRPYPVPHTMRETVQEEIQKMLEMGIIYRVDSPYASPIVIVKKPDGSNRFCIDFRKLNKITIFDSEPVGNADDIFAKLSKSKYLSKLDLTKGYWQIPVKQSCQMYTSFISSEGLFAFRKMPFGMVNAGATFCRMMRKLLAGLKDVENFVDDVIEHTEGWNDHIALLRQLLERLREACLTVRPSKCMFGYFQLSFLGHLVGNGTLRPLFDKIEAIRNCSRPASKKQIRSFIGLIGYYRKVIPNFSTISAPLTDLTKKGSPNKVVWTLEIERAFRSLIGALVKTPILCLPDMTLEFIIRTDASDVGLGAVLLQEHEGTKFPISYVSRKLLPRERSYSVIEKECLGVVWGIQKFQVYLYGREFLLETDHQPLVYLQRSKVANARLMRWALALQMYKFRIVSIKGSENVAADFLSRHV